MSINTKAYEKACSRQMTLLAKIAVYNELKKIALENAEENKKECWNCVAQAWQDASRDIDATLSLLEAERFYIERRINAMRGSPC